MDSLHVWRGLCDINRSRPVCCAVRLRGASVTNEKNDQSHRVSRSASVCPTYSDHKRAEAEWLLYFGCLLHLHMLNVGPVFLISCSGVDIIATVVLLSDVSLFLANPHWTVGDARINISDREI